MPHRALLVGFLLASRVVLAGPCEAPRLGAPVRLHSSGGPSSVVDFLTVDLT